MMRTFSTKQSSMTPTLIIGTNKIKIELFPSLAGEAEIVGVGATVM